MADKNTEAIGVRGWWARQAGAIFWPDSLRESGACSHPGASGL